MNAKIFSDLIEKYDGLPEQAQAIRAADAALIKNNSSVIRRYYASRHTEEHIEDQTGVFEVKKILKEAGMNFGNFNLPPYGRQYACWLVYRQVRLNPDGALAAGAGSALNFACGHMAWLA